MKGEAGWLINSDFGLRVIADAVTSCGAVAAGGGRACDVLLEARAGHASMAAGSCLVNKSPPPTAMYWGYDYSASGSWKTLHPCSTDRLKLVESADLSPVAEKTKDKDAHSVGELAAIREGCYQAVALRTQVPPVPSLPSPDSVSTAPTPTPTPTPTPQALPDSSNSKSWEQWPLPPFKDGPPCVGSTVYMQIHGPEMREKVRAFRSLWNGQWRANVPPIEDVVATAFRAARPAPKPVTITTVRYHDDTGKRCAGAIVDAVRSKTGEAWRLEPLSSAYTGAKGVIEVWFSADDKAVQTVFDQLKSRQ